MFPRYEWYGETDHGAGVYELVTNRSRVAITLASTLLLGATHYGYAFDINPPGVLGDIWHASNWITYALVILGVFLVYRWWALLPAVAPAAVTVYLYKMTDYVPPWREESWSFDQPFLYAVLVVGGIVLSAAILALGLLLRAGWESVRSKRRGPCCLTPL